MCYPKALPKFWFVSCVDSLLTITDRHWQKLAATFEKFTSSNGCLFMWGSCFSMGAYKCDVVDVIKMGAYIHGVLISMGAYYSDFMVDCKPR